MPEPEVVAAMRRFRELLAVRDEAALRALARRWAQLERALEGQITALAEEAARRAAAGELVSRHMVLRWGRYERLLAQLQAEATRFAVGAGDLIIAEQRTAAALGVQHGAALVELLVPAIQGAFDVLPVAALEYMIGLVGDGSPLRAYLLRVYPQAAEAMLDALVQGVGQGWGAVKIAREMRRNATVGLRTAMNTARTETLRVYRQASMSEYQASEVVDGYLRLAAKSDRTCPACLFMDGKWFELSVPFEEHNLGRCVAVPALRGRPRAASWQTGAQWFEGLPANRQREILGPGLYNAWQAKKIGLDEIPVLHEDPVWGNAWVPARVPK